MAPVSAVGAGVSETNFNDKVRGNAVGVLMDVHRTSTMQVLMGLAQRIGQADGGPVVEHERGKV